jgi:hypothetical protein
VSPVIFLVAFLVLSLLGAFFLWVRDRTPRSMEAQMKAFERELDALSPQTPIGPPARRRRPAQRTRGPRTG